MKVVYQILLICCVGIVASVPTAQVTVFSSLKTEVQRGQIKDFIGCKEKKKILVGEDCTTEGDKKNQICKNFKEKLEKKLDCKDKCKVFYKKYNELQIERAEEQKKFYEKEKDQEKLQEAEEEIYDLNENQKAFIELSCAGDFTEIGEQISDALEKEDKKKK